LGKFAYFITFSSRHGEIAQILEFLQIALENASDQFLVQKGESDLYSIGCDVSIISTQISEPQSANI
jgi:hypothetical protein